MTATPIPDPPALVPSSPEPSHPHLRRSTTNKVLGGVCGGLAEFTDTDPLIWRVGFIALAVMGAGVLVYPLLWLLVPAAEPAGSATVAGLQQTLRNGRSARS